MSSFFEVISAVHPLVNQVPEFRPLEAGVLLRRWLARQPLQPYVK